MRGTLHEIAFFVSVPAGIALIALANTGKARFAAIVFATGLVGVFGASAAYHRVAWSVPARKRMKRLDHSMIFVLIAGTYTPFAVLVLDDPMSSVVLAGVWGGAAAGIVFTLLWIDAPAWLVAAAYIALGWFSIVAIPQIVDRTGAGALALLAAGGAAYTAGAVIYARKRPDPRPASFGYHEIFHVLVVVAAAAHFAAIAAFAVPHASSG
jgi:hemolysin III